jgi:hypothetical protein
MAKVTKAARTKEIVKMLLSNLFVFERQDGTRGAILKTSPRRPSFTADLDALTPVECAAVGAAVTEVLTTISSDSPEVKAYLDERCKKWDGKRKKS